MVGRTVPRGFEAALVRQCAPTLAGLKPGSIFCFKHSSLEVSRQKVCQWNERLTPLGLEVRILLERPDSGSVIVYVYRRDLLERLLAHLTYRLQTQAEFPHEIGVFLGYPLRDVVGFIENRGRNFTCCGFWKSYSDPVETQACFACYRNCIRTYVSLFEQGIPIEILAVSA